MKTLRSLAALVAAFVILFAPVAGLAAEQVDGRSPSNGQAGSGQVIAIFDNGSWRVIRGDSNGNAFTYDRSTDDWQLGNINLRNNQPINTEFTSQVIDARKYGGKPYLYISWPGGTAPLFVAVDYLYSASVDSTMIFRARLGRSDPRNIGVGTMRMLNAGAVAIDSTGGGGGVRSSWAIPLFTDSLGVPVGAGPYCRVHIWSNAQVNGVYAHLMGKP